MREHDDEHTKANGGPRRKGANFNYKNREGFMEEEEVQIGSYKRETTHGLRNPTSKGSENTHT